VPLSDDLDLLENSLRQLHIEWDKFFGGVERKPPNELKARVEGLIRKYAYAEVRNNAERFRYQSLSSRYNTFNELWTKKLRALEEGRPVGLHGARVVPSPPPAEAPAAAPSGAARAAAPPARGALGEVRVRDAEADAGAVKALYENFLQARKATGESAAVKFESFQKLISQQAAKILTDKGAQAVDFRLETKDGKVSLKARPVK
jgi:hypothetical protein